MENHIKIFFDYLFYIGITSEQTSSIIIQLLSNKYNNIKNNPINIDDLLKDLICDYLKMLTEEQLKIVGINIYEQFSKNSLITKIKHLKRLITVKHRYDKRRIKKFFNIWRLNSINLSTIISNYKTSSFYKKNNDYINNINNNNILYSSSSFSLHNFLNKLELYSNRKNKNIEKLKEINESNILNICTFSPKIISNRKQKKGAVNHTGETFSKDGKKGKIKENIYKHLYNDYKNKMIDREELRKKIDDKCGYTFSPKINSNDIYIKKIQDNFFERYKKSVDKQTEFFLINNHHSLKKSFSTKNL